MDPVSPSQFFSPFEPGGMSLLIYAVLVIGAVFVLLLLIKFVGEKRPGTEKNRPYECGIIPTGTAQFRYPIPFYLLAVFFVVFDVEAVFIFAWAVSFRDLGWSGYLRISIFILVLLFSLFYIWKKGALDWKNVK
ncbi:MAG: NADH-quinone oxidoreductase subunit A [Deltaproteobacteria bacterium]